MCVAAAFEAVGRFNKFNSLTDDRFKELASSQGTEVLNSVSVTPYAVGSSQSLHGKLRLPLLVHANLLVASEMRLLQLALMVML